MVKLVPNILTFIRLGLTFVFLLMILYSPGVTHQAIFLDGAFVLFVVAGLTDILDGIVARRFNATSKFGRMVDPLVDKVLVCGAFICFAIIGEPKLFGLSGVALAFIHWFVVAVLVLREAYVTVLRHIAEANGINFAATISGKLKMLTQSFAIGTVLIKMAYVKAAWGDWFTAIVFAVMVVITAVSGFLATRRSSWRQLKKEEASHEKSTTSV
jgi:CDP-diacylglycerol--glycerol-3-phosphate 3-phosphatidyltransferase